jgi:hypothetical protein
VSLLIVGGLLIIGVLAIVGAVMLSIGEQRRDAANKLTAGPTQSALVIPPQTTEATRSARPTVPLEEKRVLVPNEEEQLRSTLNGQFHELSHEIRSLHDQAGHLEQRLGLLTDMIDRIERSRGGHTNVEEDANIPIDNTLV